MRCETGTGGRQYNQQRAPTVSGFNHRREWGSPRNRTGTGLGTLLQWDTSRHTGPQRRTSCLWDQHLQWGSAAQATLKASLTSRIASGHPYHL